MKQSGMIGVCLLLTAAIVLLLSLPVQADDGMQPPAGAITRHASHSPWIQHTQSTLDELKGKLNLAPEQLTAWTTWSDGVTRDAQRQLEQEKSWGNDKTLGVRPTIDASTPERMLRGIERLRAQSKWMQQQLVQLEAAQVRTKNFYEALTVNQRTIFDLFWHLLHHRLAGSDDDGGMAMASCRGEFDGPPSGH